MAFNCWNPAWTHLTASEFSPAFRVLTGAVMISFSGVWVKFAHVTPTISAFYRLSFGGLILIFMVLFQKRSLWHSWRYFGFVVSAALSFALDLFAWHRSIYYVGPGLATILANFQVFFLSIAGVLFLKESIGSNRVLGILFAIIGLFLIVGVDWRVLGVEYHKGVFFGLVTAVFYTGYILSLKRIQGFSSPLSPVTNLMFVSLIGAAFLGFEALQSGETFAIPDGQSFMSLLLLGVCGQVLGWVFISSGLGKVRASLAGLMLLLQPSLAFVWDVLFFGKAITWNGILGASISISAIYLGSIPPKTRNR